MEREHEVCACALDHPPCRALAIALSDGTPRAVPEMIHVTIELSLEPWMVGEKGDSGVFFRRALPGIQQAREARRVARRLESARAPCP